VVQDCWQITTLERGASDTSEQSIHDPDQVERLRKAVMFTARWLRAGSATESLSPAQSGVLATLERTGPCRPATSPPPRHSTRPCVARVIKHLESAGLVQRDPDPADGRAYLVRATREGRRLVRRLRAHRRELVGERLDELSPEHVRLIMAALPALEALAGRRDHEAAGGR